VNSEIILTATGQAVIVAVAVLGWLSTRQKVEKVHRLATKTEKLVNNQLDRQLKYNQELSAALIAAGVAVPQQEQPGHGEAGERLAPPN
jgi:hypothetical protein